MRDGKNRLVAGVLSVSLLLAMAMGGLVPAVAGAEEAAMGTESVAGQKSGQGLARQTTIPTEAASGEMGTQELAPQEEASPQAATPKEVGPQSEGQEAPAADTELKVESDEANPAQLETQAWYDMSLTDTWVDGSINDKGGANFYKIVLSEPSKLSVTYQGLSISNSRFELLNYDQSISYESIQAYTSTESNPVTKKMTMFVDAGEYYVKVYSDYNRVGSYRLRASFTPVRYTEIEPNNDSDHAMPLSVGTKVWGFFSVQDNADLYRINVHAPTTVIFTAENTDNDHRAIYYSHYYSGGIVVFDENLKEVASRSQEKAQFSEEVKLSAGTYYIRLDRHSDSGGPYTFKWNYAFPDVPVSHWAYDVVSQAVDRGLFSGYDDGNFGPDNPVTRGQAAVVLWKMAGQPQSYDGKYFSDVTSRNYFYSAVQWASSVGVASGYSNGNFGPNDKITREDLAVMLANYTQKVAGKTVSGSYSDYSSMYDAGSVVSYAQTAMGWCFQNNILTGSDGLIRPKASASRAESAKMFWRVYEMTQ